MNQEPGQEYEDPDETRKVEEDKEPPGDQAVEDPETTKEWEADK